jgi:hypothetical protein
MLTTPHSLVKRFLFVLLLPDRLGRIWRNRDKSEMDEKKDIRAQLLVSGLYLDIRLRLHICRRRIFPAYTFHNRRQLPDVPL